jgi:predicted nucleic acid-binding protein
MITAVDTSVIIDVLGADPTFGRGSRAALRQCSLEGRIVASEVVWAEVYGFFGATSPFLEAMASLRAEFSAMSPDAAITAGRTWRAYRDRGGPRTRLLADFFVGAHAVHHADRLLTRDVRFHKTYLSDLVLFDPSQD